MHTPAPWTAKRTPASAYFDWAVEAKSGQGRVMSVGVDTDNSEADAKLIAAAPELLAALKALHAKPTPGTLEQALAAIAKAES
jgi:hypothetical protein